MARPIRTIDVYPNPYAGIDHDGVPQGVEYMPGSRNYVGAARDLVACEQTGKTRIYYATPNAAKGETGAHGLRKVTVPFTPEIARAVLEGALIVATEEHARMAGLSGFVAPEAQLEAERQRALAERRAQYGDDAELAAVPLTPTERPDPAKASEEQPAAAKAAKGKPAADKPLGGVPLAGGKTNPSLALRTSEES